MSMVVETVAVGTRGAPWNVTLYGNISNYGVSTVTAFGFEHNITPSGTGVRTMTRSGHEIVTNGVSFGRVYRELVPNKTNYFRAWAENGSGVGYGNWSSKYINAMPTEGVYNIASGIRKLFFKDPNNQNSSALSVYWVGTSTMTPAFSTELGNGSYPQNRFKGKGFRNVVDTVVHGSQAYVFTQIPGTYSWFHTDQNATSDRRGNVVDFNIRPVSLSGKGVYVGYMVGVLGNAGNYTVKQGYRFRLANSTYYLDKFEVTSMVPFSGTWTELRSGNITITNGSEYWVRILYMPKKFTYGGGNTLKPPGYHLVTVDNAEETLGIGGIKKFHYVDWDYLGSGTATTRFMYGAYVGNRAELDMFTYAEAHPYTPEYVTLDSELRLYNQAMEFMFSSKSHAADHYSEGDYVEMWANHELIKVNSTNGSVKGFYVESIRMFDGKIVRSKELEGYKHFTALDTISSAYGGHSDTNVPSGVDFYSSMIAGGIVLEYPTYDPLQTEAYIQRFPAGYGFGSAHYPVPNTTNWDYYGPGKKLLKMIDTINGASSYWSPYGFRCTDNQRLVTPYRFDQVNASVGGSVPIAFRMSRKANVAKGYLNELRIYHQAAGGGGASYTEFSNATDILEYGSPSGETEVVKELPYGVGTRYAREVFQRQNMTGPIVDVKVMKCGYDIEPGQVVYLRDFEDERVNGQFVVIHKRFFYSSNPDMAQSPTNPGLEPGSVGLLCVPYKTDNIPFEDNEGEWINRRMGDSTRMDHYFV